MDREDLLIIGTVLKMSIGFIGLIWSIALFFIGLIKKDGSKLKRAAIIFFSVAGLLLVITVIEFAFLSNT